MRSLAIAAVVATSILAPVHRPHLGLTCRGFDPRPGVGVVAVCPGWARRHR